MALLSLFCIINPLSLTGTISALFFIVNKIVERKPLGMKERNEQPKKDSLNLARVWIFTLMLLSITVFGFVLLRYRAQQNTIKQPDYVQTKRHVYVQPAEDQPEVPIVYEQSL